MIGRVKEPPHFDEARLHNLALTYLNRFDASAKGLRMVLMRNVRRAVAASDLSDQDREREIAEAGQLIGKLVERFQGSGLISDQRMAGHLVSSWRERGMSTRAMRARLLSKGVTADVAEAALGSKESNAGHELSAAIAFAKRRKLGCFGNKPGDHATARRDLARMARAGFSYEVAVRALQVRVDEETF